MDTQKIVTVAILAALTLPATASSKPSYKDALKEWTRTDKVYVWDNFEARMIWNATYLSPDFRAARREELSKRLEWTDEELARKIREDAEESAKFDVFFVTIYAGSAKWPEIGKDDGQWRFFLDTPGGKGVAAAEVERVPVSAIDRELYPHLDKWSQAYYLRFPKTLKGGGGFTLRMAGRPAKSELAWK